MDGSETLSRAFHGLSSIHGHQYLGHLASRVHAVDPHEIRSAQMEVLTDIKPREREVQRQDATCLHVENKQIEQEITPCIALLLLLPLLPSILSSCGLYSRSTFRGRVVFIGVGVGRPYVMVARLFEFQRWHHKGQEEGNAPGVALAVGDSVRGEENNREDNNNSNSNLVQQDGNLPDLVLVLVKHDQIRHHHDVFVDISAGIRRVFFPAQDESMTMELPTDVSDIYDWSLNYQLSAYRFEISMYVGSIQKRRLRAGRLQYLE